MFSVVLNTYMSSLYLSTFFIFFNALLCYLAQYCKLLSLSAQVGIYSTCMRKSIEKHISYTGTFIVSPDNVFRREIFACSLLLMHIIASATHAVPNAARRGSF